MQTFAGLCCSLMGTLKQVKEALQPLQKLLELINPRYESELRHTFEQGRLNRVTNVAGISMSFSAAKATAVSVGPAGGYLNAQGTAGNLVLPSETARHGTQSLRSNPGIAKGLRRARDEHGGECGDNATMVAFVIAHAVMHVVI